LGVSPQAVSKWEVEGCYPDLELLAPMASFFNITIDELMGFDSVKSKEKIDEIFKLAHEKSNKGLLAEELELIRNAVQEFPNSYELLAHLAHILRMIKTETDEEKQKNLRESIAINERILEDCTNDEIRDGVLQKLTFCYKDIGEKGKAVVVARKLAYMYCSSNQVLTHIYEGEELYGLLVNNAIAYIDLLTGTLTHLGWSKYQNDLNKKIKVYKKAVDIIELIWEDGDYGFYNCRLAEFYMAMAKSYIALEDVENTLDCLEKMAKYAVMYDTASTINHTSVIFENTEYNPAGPSKNYDYNDCYMFLNTHGMNEKFISIKNDERYKAVVAQLEKYAKKER
jgi:transcriptional regulator with XRE-family HTH domain